MNCKKVREILIKDYEPQLAEKTQQEMKVHLNHCPACLAYQQSLSGIIGQLKKIKPVKPADRVWVAIKHEIEKNRAVSTSLSPTPFFSFNSSWLHRAFVISLFLLTVASGNYCASKIVPEESLSAVLPDHLYLSAFNDLPHEQLEIVYTAMVGD